MSKKLMMNNYSEIDCDFYLKNKSFDGISDYVDTGLNLFDTDSDWCIYINFTNLGKADNYPRIIHNLEEKPPYPGVTLSINNANRLDLGGSFGWWSFSPLTPGLKLVFFRRGSSIGYKVANQTIREGYGYVFEKIDYNLLIGCDQKMNGVKGGHWKGIVHELIVYKNKTVTNEEIDSLLQRG